MVRRSESSGTALSRRGFLKSAGATLSVMGLAACAPTPAASPTAPPAAGKPAPATAAPATSSGAKTTVVVSSWHWREVGGMQSWWEYGKQQFEQKFPDIAIEARYVPYNQYFDQMYVEMGAGNPADIYSANQPASFVMMAGGQVEPLNKWVEKSSVAKDFVPIINSPVCSSNGNIYMVPMNQLTGHYLHYNKAMLDAVGAKAPTTPQEFYDVAKKVNNPPSRFGALLDTGTADPLYQQLVLAAIGFGGNWWDVEKPKTPTANSKPVLEAMTWYKSLITDGLVPRGADSIGHIKMYSEERVAMFLSGTYAMGQIKANNAALVPNTIVTPLPWKDGRTFVVSLGNMMAKGSKNKDAAWEY
ncbi:MAG: extracellular solute-binding protein, partial [Planctomycetes bacterium]|nr:extracellular solute-binding protein [Planctomycetota bacterium]